MARPLDPRDPPPVPRAAVWAEDVSVILGVAGAVLTIGTLLAVLWLTFWGVAVLHEPGVALIGGVDLVLVLLAVLFHHLALELSVAHDLRGEVAHRADR